MYTRKCHNPIPQSHPWHRETETQTIDSHATAITHSLKPSSKPSLPHNREIRAQFQNQIKPRIYVRPSKEYRLTLIVLWKISWRNLYKCILKGSILQYLRPSLIYHLSLRPLFCLFLSDRLRQVNPKVKSIYPIDPFEFTECIII